MNLQRKKSICVYCAHRDGAKPSYLQAAQDTGEMIARLNMRLVYGAGSVGLMGKVANSAQSGNAEVFGVIPEHLLDLEIGKDDIDSFIVTENMHERKKIMVLNSDAFILLPGGF
ncbi:TIGR00730 family Rossman fold protein, partial [Amylibacter sp.]|nr:TIGR00730 family Rossman fold protein [Amylibacter sp.]